MLIGLQCYAIVYAHAQFNPSDLGGLQLWLKADSGVTLNGNFVSQWADLSGQSNHATSDFDVIRPTVYADAINGLPGVSFDGVDDFLQFPEISDVRTVFWVLRENSGATGAPPRPLLGWSGGLHFLRGDNEQIWNGQFAAPEVFNGQTRLNAAGVNGANTWLNEGFNMVSLRTTGNIAASHLTMELNIYGRTWWGEMAEIIIYNQPLSDAEIIAVEEYLRQRYIPAYEPMADMEMGSSLCDTTLCIPSGFVDVVWNDTLVGSCMNVQASGQYTVQFADIFGRLYTDTVAVEYILDDASINDAFCIGNVYQWSTTEQSFGLNFDGVEVTEVATGQAGPHELIVTDEEGCTKSIHFELEEDIFETTHQIAEQDIYCADAVLQIEPSLSEETMVVWNDEFEQDNWTLGSSGLYWVMATNELGCVMRDTVDVNLAGNSSAIEILAYGACVGTATVLSVQVLDGENIVNGTWQFGDGASAEAVSVSHTYLGSGNYTLEFVGVNSSGCVSYATHNHVIHALPALALSIQGQCVNAPVSLHAEGSSSDGNIIQYDWLIDGQFLQGQDLMVDMDLVGFNNIIVSAMTEYGCMVEWSQLHQIFGKPEIVASVDTVCHGALSQFGWQLTASGNGQPGVSLAWEFGDGTGSVQIQPFHFYTYANTYDAWVVSTNSNGCSDTTHIDAVVYGLPEADFLVTNYCEHETEGLIDMTSSEVGDPVVAWNWTLDGVANFTGQQPNVSFVGAGLHPVFLEVTTQHGCMAEVLQQIPVWPAPVVSFLWEPLIAGAPWNVPFAATSTLPAQYQWFFGDGSTGDGANTEHVFGMNGTYNVQLTGTTSQGCSQSVAQIITVADPIKDAAIQAVQITSGDNGSLIQVQVRNNGNVKLEELLMTWQLGGDAPVIETWYASLAPGETYLYEFNSRVSEGAAQYPYLCVYAETTPWLVQEQNLTDNAFCKPLVSGGLEVFAPYPNPGDDRMFVRLIAPNNGVINMRVHDSKGQQVMVFEDLEVDQGFQQFFIDISSLSNGSYRLVAEMSAAKSVVSFLKIAR